MYAKNIGKQYNNINEFKIVTTNKTSLFLAINVKKQSVTIGKIIVQI